MDHGGRGARGKDCCTVISLKKSLHLCMPNGLITESNPDVDSVLSGRSMFNRTEDSEQASGMLLPLSRLLKPSQTVAMMS